MAVELTARIMPIVVVVNGQVGLTLWAPPWDAGGDQTWEAFLGADGSGRVAMFATSTDLHAFLRSAEVADLSMHPAWAGILRRSADQLRAAPDAVIDLDSVYETVEAGDLTRAARAVHVAAAIGVSCGDTELDDHITETSYRYLFGPASAFVGRDGKRRRAAVESQIATSWEWVADRVAGHLDWHGDTGHVDSDAILAPTGTSDGGASTPDGSVRNPSLAPSSGVDAGYSALAIASFVLAFVAGFGLPGVVLGHMALRDIRRTGKRGHGLAIAALVLGYLELAVLAIIVVAVVAGAGHSG